MQNQVLEANIKVSLKQESLLNKFNRHLCDQSIFQTIFEQINMQREDVLEHMVQFKERMQMLIRNYNKIKTNIFKKHKINEKLMKYNKSMQIIVNKSIQQELITSQINDMQIYTNQVDIMLYKIKIWRQNMKKINEIKIKTAKLNILFLKKYNVKNYLEQLCLVKDMVKRIDQKFSQQIPQFKFIEELSEKSFVPYNFYKQYCITSCLKFMNKKIDNNQIILFKQTHSNFFILQQIKTHFFNKKNLYQACFLYLNLSNIIKILNNEQNIVQNGFLYLFKPLLLQFMTSLQPINSIQFMKARSAMQNNQVSIDLWNQFQQICVQKYTLWYYQNIHHIRKGELLNLTKIRENLDNYSYRYEWINEIGINKRVLQLNFRMDILKLMIIIIIKPVLSWLYLENLPQKKIKQKDRNEYNLYWTYCIFAKYSNLHDFINVSVKQEINKISQHSHINQSQLNFDQYYHYYRQMSQFLHKQCPNQIIAIQFKDFWNVISSKYSIYANFIIEDKGSQLQQELQNQKLIKIQQQKLQNLIQDKKNLKNVQIKDQIYRLTLYLNLISLKYWLLRNSIKILGNLIEKQIKIFRQIAYKSFHK